VWWATAALLSGLAVSQVPAAAAATYPVPYSFAVGLAAAASGKPPAGANVVCHPSAAHPYPVVLVHGLDGNMSDNWATMSPLLADHGYCVFAFTYGTLPGNPYEGGQAPMEQSAAVLGQFVQWVLGATKAKQVDIVGHSEGATMPEYWVKFLGGAPLVHDYVGVAGVLHGTEADGLALLPTLAESFGFGKLIAGGGGCGSCFEFLIGSAYNAKVDATPLAVPGVRYTMIATRYDDLVQPYNIGFIDSPQATNITVQDQCPMDFSDHFSVIADPVTGADILNALDPDHPVPVPCSLVLPVIG
jgi:triacylglycerol esterase/lipase EstA (alpha/beta hydrolase family)